MSPPVSADPLLVHVRCELNQAYFFPAAKLLPFIRETVNNAYVSVRRKGFDPKTYRDDSAATGNGKGEVLLSMGRIYGLRNTGTKSMATS